MKTSNMNLREVHEWDTSNVIPLPVHFDGETRIRVFAGQLQDEFLFNISKHNFKYHICLYLKYAEKLNNKFPAQSSAINGAIISFWQRVQTKLKEEEKSTAKNDS